MIDVQIHLCWPDGPTSQHKEYRKEYTPVGQHKRHCVSDSGKFNFDWKIIDQAFSSIKFLTLEALHIKERPAIYTGDDVRNRELTLRL